MIYAYEILWHTFYRWLSVSISNQLGYNVFHTINRANLDSRKSLICCYRVEREACVVEGLSHVLLILVCR